MTDLNPQNVERIVRHCLYKDEEIQDGDIPDNAIVLEGVTRSFGFHPDRIEESREEIADMVSQLHDTFKEGWSFLNGCLKKDEEQWTGEHRVVEELFCLGMATGNMEMLTPREIWKVLPGCMPYFRVIA